MSKRLTTDIEPHVADYLALESAASEPYNSFVFDNKAQADEIRQLLFSSGACEYSPPFGQILLDESAPVGMIACLTGKQLTGIRLKGALELRRAGIVERYPGLQQRLQLAGQTLLKPHAEDFYLSRIAITASQRGQGTGSFLMNHFERTGRALACRRLTLEVNAADEQATNFYRKHQFVELERQQVVDAATGRTLQYMHMTKSLV